VSLDEVISDSLVNAELVFYNIEDIEKEEMLNDSLINSELDAYNREDITKEKEAPVIKKGYKSDSDSNSSSDDSVPEP